MGTARTTTWYCAGPSTSPGCSVSGTIAVVAGRLAGRIVIARAPARARSRLRGLRPSRGRARRRLACGAPRPARALTAAARRRGRQVALIGGHGGDRQTRIRAGRRRPTPASGALPHALRRARAGAVHAGRPPRGVGGPEDPIGLPGRVPVHARDPLDDVPGAAVDDAPVRRLRHQRGDQRALPLPARPRPDGALDGVRHALPDGPRLRPPPLARRGRPRGRGRGHARGHAARCSRGSTSARSRCR